MVYICHTTNVLDATSQASLAARYFVNSTCLRLQDGPCLPLQVQALLHDADLPSDVLQGYRSVRRTTSPAQL